MMTVDTENLVEVLEKLGACSDGLEWLEAQKRKGVHILADLWNTCPYGIFLSWLVWRVDAADTQALRMIVCDAAEDVLFLYEDVYPNDPRPRNAIACARSSTDVDALEAAYKAAQSAASAAYKDAKHGFARRRVMPAACAARTAENAAKTVFMICADKMDSAYNYFDSVLTDACEARTPDSRSDAEIDKACARYADIIRRYVPLARVVAAVEAQPDF